MLTCQPTFRLPCGLIADMLYHPLAFVKWLSEECSPALPGAVWTASVARKSPPRPPLTWRLPDGHRLTHWCWTAHEDLQEPVSTHPQLRNPLPGLPRRALRQARPGCRGPRLPVCGFARCPPRRPSAPGLRTRRWCPERATPDLFPVGPVSGSTEDEPAPPCVVRRQPDAQGGAQLRQGECPRKRECASMACALQRCPREDLNLHALASTGPQPAAYANSATGASEPIILGFAPLVNLAKTTDQRKNAASRPARASSMRIRCTGARDAGRSSVEK